MKRNPLFSIRIVRGASCLSAGIWLALGMSGAVRAQPTTLIGVDSTGTSTQTIDFTNSGGYSVTAGACTSCVAVSSAIPGTSGTYGFSIAMSPGTQVGPATAVAGMSGLYSETYNAPTGGGTIDVSGGREPVVATISGFTIFAAPGTDTAQIDLALRSVTVGPTGYSTGAPLYLDITGSTGTAVGFAAGASKDFNSFNLDWAGSIVSSAAGPPPPANYVSAHGVPEIDTASASTALAMLLGAFAVLRGRRKTAGEAVA
jgi:hypothetical protein